MTTHSSAGFRFDHVNLQASADSPLQLLFGDVMRMRSGERPPFNFPGSWLYGESERALLHVVEQPGDQTGAITLGHIAFRTDEAADQVLARLHSSGLAHRVTVVPRDGDIQAFVSLPGGLLIELDLPGSGCERRPVSR